jgi:hypothetical protein
MASLFQPNPFELIVQGLVQQQELEAGRTMEQIRQEALAQYLALPDSEKDMGEEFVDSSAIESFEYDPTAESLMVKWLDSRGGMSHAYLYYGVNPVIAQGLEDASSKGTYMNEVVKAGFFPFTRLS